MIVTDTTAARRQLLTLLLDRAERHALLPAEGPLLRALVAAEQDAADAWRLDLDARRERIAAALTAEHYRRAREQIVASPEEHSLALARVAIAALDGPVPTPDDEQGAADATKRRYWRGSDGIDIGHAYIAAQAALARVRALTDRLDAQAVAFQDVLDDSDRDPWARTIRASLNELRTLVSSEQPTQARCSCGVPGVGNYEGPQADCAVHGVVPAALDGEQPDADPARCVCGDPIQRWTGPGEPGWIHSPGSDTRCTDARPEPPATEPEPEPAEHPLYGHVQCGNPNPHDAHRFVIGNIAAACHGKASPTTEPEPTPCAAYQPPTTSEDSGYCARCGMTDYKHTAADPWDAALARQVITLIRRITSKEHL